MLPAITLGTGLAAILSRMVRSSLLEVMNEDYIRTARAKGLPPWSIWLRHGVRNAWLPILTLLGIQLGALLGGAVITETVFNWPGLGTLLVESIQRRDYPVVQGCVLLISLCYVAINLLTDLLYARVDPRIRLGQAEMRTAGFLALLILSLWAILACVSPWLPLHPDQVVLPAILDVPGESYLLGADDLGRPVLDRLLVGARTSFWVAAGVISLSLVSGTLLGCTGAYLGGWWDRLLVMLLDIFMAFPGILLAIALAGVLGPGIGNLVIALSLVGWVGFARLARAQVLSVKRREHVQAATALGSRTPRIIVRHLLPLIAAPLVVEATFGVAAVVIAESGLSFLGSGRAATGIQLGQHDT